jgi:hypothetical protein
MAAKSWPECREIDICCSFTGSFNGLFKVYVSGSINDSFNGSFDGASGASSVHGCRLIFLPKIEPQTHHPGNRDKKHPLNGGIVEYAITHPHGQFLEF